MTCQEIEKTVNSQKLDEPLKLCQWILLFGIESQNVIEFSWVLSQTQGYVHRTTVKVDFFSLTKMREKYSKTKW